jgi:RNA polymerase sigma-70 factor (ECF subfamily)
MVQKHSDEQLMLQVQKGNLDALAPLFEKYHVKLYNFFLRMTQNRETSQDLTQNVFRRILSYRETYNEKWAFRSWMYQIARNVSAQHFKHQKLLIDDYQETENMEMDARLADEEMAQNQKKELLHEALKRLSTEEKELLELSRFQGLKYKEIAQITGNSVAAIKVKVHRAMQKLKTYYFELA